MLKSQDMLSAALRNTAFACRLWRANGAGAVRLWWGEREHNHLHVISRNPPVVYLWWGRDDTALHEELRGEPLIVLYLFPWCTTLDAIPGVARQVSQTLKRFPRHRIVFLCNERHAVEPLNLAGVEAIFCSQNAFVNENVFQPNPSAGKEFDAVYNASLSPYKRHLLAAKVASLMMLTYSYAGTHNYSYEAEVRQGLAHAAWLKDTGRNSEKASVEQMVTFYNKARIGLILSEVEGAAFASMEYLLCGLPVVSTPSIGGREVFWDERYVIVCEPTSEAVAEAVAELKARHVSPQTIRGATLQKIEQHRERLRRFLSPAVLSFECPWNPGSHGPFTFSNLRRVGRDLRRGHLAGLP